jgi:tRNA dimethylallyltransferase
LIIAGPTASGKTAAAVDLALAVGGELVGADSVQVYRGFDIGSAKPTEEELAGVPHHLIDILDPGATIDAMRYAEMADEVIEQVRDRGKLPIVVGGTGLWIRALVRGLVNVPPVDPELRSRLELEAEQIGNARMHERLSEVDPMAAQAIHPNDGLRIIRALEVYEQTGTPLGRLRAEHALGEPRYPNLFVALDASMSELRERIEQRTQAMIERGWIEECEELLERHGADAKPFGSVGYKQVLSHIRNGVPLEETVVQIERATRVYARRQRTWLKNEPGVHLRTSARWLTSLEGISRVDAFLRGEEPTA